MPMSATSRSFTGLWLLASISPSRSAAAQAASLSMSSSPSAVPGRWTAAAAGDAPDGEEAELLAARAAGLSADDACEDIATCAFSALQLRSSSSGTRRRGRVGFDTGELAGLKPAWSARFTKLVDGVQDVSMLSTGVMQYDGLNGRWRMRDVLMVNGTKVISEKDVLADRSADPQMTATVGLGASRQCIPMPLAFQDPFGWLPSASRSKQAGSDCTRWEFQPASSATMGGLPWGVFARIQACIDKEGGLTEVVVVSHKGIATTYTFTRAQDTPGDFSPSLACIGHRCSGNGQEALTVYRLHSKDSPVTLANRNAGDALAGWDILCKPSKLGANWSGSLVTKYVVSVNTSWGPYQPCRYQPDQDLNVCSKPQRTSVGREIGLGFDHPKQAGTGQCYDSKEVGFWFSFPEEGQCALTHDIDANECSWSSSVALHSADAECLAERACKEGDGRPATYADALARLRPAFKACPDVTPR